MIEGAEGAIWITERNYGWYIAAYLFFGGLAAGTYLTGAVAELAGERSDDRTVRTSMRALGQWGMLLSLSAIGAGMAFLLVFHLGAPLRALLFPVLFVNTGSWLVIGTWVIVLFTALVAGQILWSLWGRQPAGVSAFPRTATRRLQRRLGVPIEGWLLRAATATDPGPTGRLALHGVGGVLAVVTAAYTGLKLGYVSGVVPLWNGTYLPALFLASALSIGLAATVGSAVMFEGLEGVRATAFSVADDAILLVELAVVALLVSALATGGPGAVASYERLTGEFGVVFWGVVVGVGLIAPLVLSAALLFIERRPAIVGEKRLERVVRGGYVAKFGLVVIGGIALRYLVIAVAIHAPLNV